MNTPKDDIPPGIPAFYEYELASLKALLAQGVSAAVTAATDANTTAAAPTGGGEDDPGSAHPSPPPKPNADNSSEGSGAIDAAVDSDNTSESDEKSGAPVGPDEEVLELEASQRVGTLETDSGALPHASLSPRALTLSSKLGSARKLWKISNFSLVDVPVSGQRRKLRHSTVSLPTALPSTTQLLTPSTLSSKPWIRVLRRSRRLLDKRSTTSPTPKSHHLEYISSLPRGDAIEVRGFSRATRRSGSC